MKWVKRLMMPAIGVVLLLSMKSAVRSAYCTASLEQFKVAAGEFAASASQLKIAVSAIKEHDKPSVANAISALTTCRRKYKRLEYFMEYFFDYPVNLYNRAPVYEVEEPYMEYQSPVGLQVVEGLLFEDDPFAHKKELTDQCEVVATTAADIPALLYGFQVNDGQLLESIRLELVRVSSLGITGYDAPQLRTGITEAAVALRAVSENLSPLLSGAANIHADSIRYYLAESIRLLDTHPDFNTFDRLAFLRNAMLPLQAQLSAFIEQSGLDLNTHDALNHQAAHLFRKDALDINSFLRTRNSPDLAALGKRLFSETALSSNGKRSCATCHRPDMFFTDGLIKSKDLDERHEVARNAPSLYYAAYQRLQFYDGRAGSLEEQIQAVLRNPHEMDADPDQIAARLDRDTLYKAAFSKAFGLRSGAPVTAALLAGALAAYEQTLAPFSSPFDRYMNGVPDAMSAEQQRGFNLFMGKAQCGTCHFAPLFNGLLPPCYERSEVEVLGVPQRTGRRLHADSDSGRFGFFAISFNKGAFKTSTVRNSAVTAPYMHNGVFKTLEEVINFYNKGGGRGMKLDVAEQTLSDKPLGLSRQEKKELVAFLTALTDQPLQDL